MLQLTQILDEVLTHRCQSRVFKICLQVLFFEMWGSINAYEVILSKSFAYKNLFTNYF